MSLSEIIAELPRLSAEERWQVIEQAMALDDLSVDHLRLIEQRIAAHEQAPESSIESTQMIAELREKYCP
ncbi:MAG TPA: hypothetical protein VFG14_18710 [Chthoniobacteraceae bacterium]|nr:hypothetical protein [Chthoniobacteraceae bacterium]